ncbi:hypothetical protein NDU88_005935 [Pleurodeles waltl]|uniref:Uncharacterized protein n=1 Tax=Pleurodeles waltl TaxID=8319 RepID=A0AAV7QG60_PLEWA|nr:hypothetical protein NDU88_005935 [Pleurodeles waltl]
MRKTGSRHCNLHRQARHQTLDVEATLTTFVAKCNELRLLPHGFSRDLVALLGIIAGFRKLAAVCADACIVEREVVDTACVEEQAGPSWVLPSMDLLQSMISAAVEDTMRDRRLILSL